MVAREKVRKPGQPSVNETVNEKVGGFKMIPLSLKRLSEGINRRIDCEIGLKQTAYETAIHTFQAWERSILLPRH
jgi:hypothetical protein